MNMNFNEMLETLTFQSSYAQYIQYTSGINKLSKAGAVLVNTIAGLIIGLLGSRRFQKSLFQSLR